MEGRSRNGGGLESLPSYLLVHEVLLKLDLPSLCSLSCVSSGLRSAASQALSLLPSLDICELSADVSTLNHIVSRCRGFETLAVSCLRLKVDDIPDLLRPHVRELNLMGGAMLTPGVLRSVSKRCPDLRSAMVDVARHESPLLFANTLEQLRTCCKNLECLCIKVRGDETYLLQYPNNLKSLKLQPVLGFDALEIVIRSSNPIEVEPLNLLHPLVSRKLVQSFPSAPKLQKLSLDVSAITDELVITIARELPNLLELDLEDMHSERPLISHDLTNVGLRSLASCHRLKSLFLERNRRNHPVSFRRISDMGIFFLLEGCRDLESIRLNGFSKVTDAGFTTILQSCRNLKKFEVRNAPLLSDLTFHDLAAAPCSLSELRVLSCNLITSESMKKLASYNSLELLDLNGCRSIADIGISSISSLFRLTTLHIVGADVTDTGLLALGQGTSPITSLSLRGCKRVTDRGISNLLQSGGTIKNSLQSLDLGHMPGISDLAIHKIVDSGVGITELCIRSCFYITDSSIKALSKRETPMLRKLDIYNWSDFSEVCEERPWLTVCFYGCEMGCHDGWQYHPLT